MVSYGFAYFASPEASKSTFVLSERNELVHYSCNMDLTCYAAFLAGLLTFLVASSLQWHIIRKEKAKQKEKEKKASEAKEEQKVRYVTAVMPSRRAAAYV